jgi:hypothetical protein
MVPQIAKDFRDGKQGNREAMGDRGRRREIEEAEGKSRKPKEIERGDRRLRGAIEDREAIEGRRSQKATVNVKKPSDSGFDSDSKYHLKSLICIARCKLRQI